jgi:hypothetical protein
MTLRAIAPALAAACLAVSTAAADDFRIHTRLFQAGDDEPTSENTTLFRAGLVYDFAEGATEITIFDAPRERFVLLDRQREIRCEVRTADIDRAIEELKSLAAADERDARRRFLAAPQFDIEPDVAANQLTFRSPWLTYRIVTEPAPTEEAARQYVEFSDWYARLNTLAGRGALPFARIAVDAELGRRQVVPQEVRLTLEAAGPLASVQKDVELRTEHRVAWGLSTEDLSRIDRTGRDLVDFEQVDFANYRGDTDRQARR